MPTQGRAPSPAPSSGQAGPGAPPSSPPRPLNPRAELTEEQARAIMVNDDDFGAIPIEYRRNSPHILHSNDFHARPAFIPNTMPVLSPSFPPLDVHPGFMSPHAIPGSRYGHPQPQQPPTGPSQSHEPSRGCNAHNNMNVNSNTTHTSRSPGASHSLLPAFGTSARSNPLGLTTALASHAPISPSYTRGRTQGVEPGSTPGQRVGRICSPGASLVDNQHPQGSNSRPVQRAAGAGVGRANTHPTSPIAPQEEIRGDRTLPLDVGPRFCRVQQQSSTGTADNQQLPAENRPLAPHADVVRDKDTDADADGDGSYGVCFDCDGKPGAY
ncbi:uncharacterized protein Z518_07758 [Rhinocladiella mackenziei CBS 650.93]|uniref:Uncharacterized protein n=1 Tax=Rhinocladiella mackenziei CBS 650.93 TaxID=1442369 RepID=A0A0D2IEE8_9EURO|nr:uncharacterized protein Z518_07758 [Rhinocladiella mackenziei CBS 650.93]KIX04204.1 hypothetical protein Z518_07758 [Rhinocladiella mackenziei CBS 650.93]